jgi:hypothetical protein
MDSTTLVTLSPILPALIDAEEPLSKDVRNVTLLSTGVELNFAPVMVTTILPDASTLKLDVQLSINKLDKHGVSPVIVTAVPPKALCWYKTTCKPTGTSNEDNASLEIPI